MTNKTPFELRFDVLALAKDVIMENMMSERTKLENDWYQKVETARSNNVEPPESPVFPTLSHDKIMDLAKTFDSFVSNYK